MTNTLDTPEEFREFMNDGRGQSTPPTWRFIYTPRLAKIGPASLWPTAGAHFVIFATLTIAMRWANMHVELVRDFRPISTIAVYWFAIMAVGFLVGTFLFEKFRNRRPWLSCEVGRREIVCPRLGKTFPAGDVYALQVIKGKNVAKSSSETSESMVVELNIIVTEDGRLQRYPLIATGGSSLAGDARGLSDFCDVPLLLS